MARQHHAGVVMVKPHAFEQALTPVVADILNGGEAAKRLSADDPLRSFLGSIQVRSTVVQDLRSHVVGVNLLDVFYKDKQQRRYFPLLMERYMGRVAFLPYTFRGDAEELPHLYDTMKGSAETFDAEGRIVSPPRGVRGLLSKPYMAVDASALLLDDAAYRERCLPMIDNFFHVCDSQQQNEQALQLLGLEEGLEGDGSQLPGVAPANFDSLVDLPQRRSPFEHAASQFDNRGDTL